MSYEIAYQFIFSFMLVFCRLGALMAFVPVVSEAAVSVRIKLLFALMLSFIVVMSFADKIPALPESFSLFLFYIFSEVSLGVVLGILIKMLMSAIHIVGMVFGYQSGLASGSIFDPTQGSQGSIFGNFLSLCFLMLILSTNLHTAIIKACALTYDVFPVGYFFENYGAFTDTIMRVASDSYIVGIKIAMPFLVIGVLFNISAGVLSRMMPQIQIFFIILPAQIGVHISIFMVIIGSSLLWFLEYYEQYLVKILG